MIRDEALALLHEYTPNLNLRRHAYAVEAAMRALATRMNGDLERWGLCGLIHDFDYERFPDLTDHPYRGVEILREKGMDEEFLTAVLGHGDHTGVARASDMAKALYAVDELCGFLVAVALVRPSRDLDGLEWSSVKKKLKDRAFARAVDREAVSRGARELGMELPELVALVRDALQAIAPQLGLGPNAQD